MGIFNYKCFSFKLVLPVFTLHLDLFLGLPPDQEVSDSIPGGAKKLLSFLIIEMFNSSEFEC